jgi:hypothetical protein
MPDTINDVDEHPIIFNEWSIQRILAGEKTQTRRIVDPQPDPDRELEIYPYHHERPVLDGMKYDNRWKPYPEGGVLWVREGFQLAKRLDDTSPKEAATEDGMVEPPVPQVRYEADGRIITEADGWGRKRPSTHMPRELCRLRLRVEDVRVERVQEIDGGDASAEGVQPPRPEIDNGAYSIHDVKRHMFREKWNDIHGDGAWERNDWVWVVSFDRIDNA